MTSNNDGTDRREDGDTSRFIRTVFSDLFETIADMDE
jgi:hypothetical protein